MSTHERRAKFLNLFGCLMMSLTLVLVGAGDSHACDRTYLPANPPWDATDPDNAWHVSDIRQNHCNETVRALKGGVHGNPVMLMQDIHYALQRMPNQRDCLTAVVKYQAKKNFPVFPQDAKYPTADCYISNAQSLFPHDLYLWSLQGLNLYYHRNYKAAAEAFQYVIDKQPKNAEAYYNLGLVRFELKDYKAAAESATKAYSLGFPLEGLKRKLAKVGAWPQSSP